LRPPFRIGAWFRAGASRIKRLLVGDKVVDTPELDEVRDLVVATLSPWEGLLVGVNHIPPG
jgi:hypothetical protein